MRLVIPIPQLFQMVYLLLHLKSWEFQIMFFHLQIYDSSDPVEWSDMIATQVRIVLQAMELYSLLSSKQLFNNEAYTQHLYTIKDALQFIDLI